MDTRDLRFLMIATFMYSLGKNTFMPEFIANLIIEKESIFNNSDWQQFIQEIHKKKDLGDSQDMETWKKFLEFSQKRMQNTDVTKK